MHANPGAGTPPTGGDDEVWRDLVARLEQAPDSFMEDSSTENRFMKDTASTDQAGPAKSVADFDPLGVWAKQSEPAPHDPGTKNQYGDAYDAGAVAAFGPRDYAVEDDDDTFVPAELPSLSNTEPAIMMSWIAAAGGPLFLVFSAIFWRQMPAMLVVAVIMGFLAGTGYLLYRLPNHRDHDNGDGAVV